MLSTLLMLSAVLAGQAGPNSEKLTRERLEAINRPYIGLVAQDYDVMVEILTKRGIKPPKYRCVFVENADPLGPCKDFYFLDIVSHVNDAPIESGPKYVELVRKAMADGAAITLTTRSVHDGKGKGDVTWRSTRRVRIQPTTRKEIALSAVETHTDEVEQRSWVQHKGAFESVVGQNLMLAKFSLLKDKTPHYPRLEVGYTARSWLFIEGLKWSCGDESISASVNSPFREVIGGGRITEVATVFLGSKEIAFFDQNSDSATLRYKGDKLYVDRELEADELWAVKRVIDAYVAMGGKIDWILPP
ncbi:MAG: hypothetical protein KF777_15825 [Planctomycetaceae bacterium]|nr:hypothetical protein [Planctomycetaceae bacterium]